jgi:hypothetical protein
MNSLAEKIKPGAALPYLPILSKACSSRLIDGAAVTNYRFFVFY